MADLLIQLDAGAWQRCVEQRDVPAPADVRIVVAAGGGASIGTRQTASDLFDGLRAACATWGATQAVSACGGQYHGTGQCMADSNPAAIRDVNILVVVEDASVDIDLAMVAAFRSLPNATTIPVAYAGIRQIPSPALRHNVIRHFASPAEVVPDILLAAAIGEDEFAVFVSYRHEDSADVAAQVFHGLAEQRFAVFLDRFRGAPGQNFVQLIMAELFEKGCLVLLEGPETHRSPWVWAEVAIATTYRIGIVRIDLPGSLRLFPADVMHQFSGPAAKPAVPLACADVDAVVALVRGSAARLGARRRAFLQNSFDQALASVPQLQRAGPNLLANRHGTTYAVDLAARPPSVGRFRTAATRGNAGRRSVLVAPLVQQLPGERMDTGWLAQVAGVAAVDEGALVPALVAMAVNRL